MWEDIEQNKNPNSYSELGETLKNLVTAAADKGLPAINMLDLRMFEWYPTSFPNLRYFMSELMNSICPLPDFQTTLHKEDLQDVILNLAARVEGSPTSGYDGYDFSPILQLDKFKHVWELRAEGNNNLSIDNSGEDDIPSPVQWLCSEDTTDADKILTFLQCSEGTLPMQLREPPPNLIERDRQVRARALRGLSGDALLSILARNTRAAASLAASTSWYQDYLGDLEHGLLGMRHVFAPQTRYNILEAVATRVELREAAIPEEISATTRSLFLKSEPFSPHLYGSFEGVKRILLNKKRLKK